MGARVKVAMFDLLDVRPPRPSLRASCYWGPCRASSGSTSPTLQSPFPALGYAAIGISFMVLTAGCNIGTVSAHARGLTGGPGIRLDCHLY
jgi:hypothetical protein